MKQKILEKINQCHPSLKTKTLWARRKVNMNSQILRKGSNKESRYSSLGFYSFIELIRNHFKRAYGLN
jgi:hypothetical protein